MPVSIFCFLLSFLLHGFLSFFLSSSWGQQKQKQKQQKQPTYIFVYKLSVYNIECTTVCVARFGSIFQELLILDNSPGFIELIINTLILLLIPPGHAHTFHLRFSGALACCLAWPACLLILGPMCGSLANWLTETAKMRRKHLCICILMHCPKRIECEGWPTSISIMSVSSWPFLYLCWLG